MLDPSELGIRLRDVQHKVFRLETLPGYTVDSVTGIPARMPANSRSPSGRGFGFIG